MRSIVVGISLLAISSTVMAAESYTIDSSHTFPHFQVNHLGFSTMHGRFDKTEGKLTIDMAKKTGSVQVKIDAASVNTGFAKRDEHLRSPDFFNAAEFPAITYDSTKVTIRDDKSATVEGNLTMVGVTKPVTLQVSRMSCGDHPIAKGKYACGFDATASIKRSDFGIKYALPAVGDDLKLVFEVEAFRN